MIKISNQHYALPQGTYLSYWKFLIFFSFVVSSPVSVFFETVNFSQIPASCFRNWGFHSVFCTQRYLGSVCSLSNKIFFEIPVRFGLKMPHRFRLFFKFGLFSNFLVLKCSEKNYKQLLFRHLNKKMHSLGSTGVNLLKYRVIFTLFFQFFSNYLFSNFFSPDMFTMIY